MPATLVERGDGGRQSVFRRQETVAGGELQSQFGEGLSRGSSPPSFKSCCRPDRRR